MLEKGLVFDIQRFSLHDGPGIRTLVFLKGCPLHCIWCANPEGIAPKNQLKFVERRCTGCGKCVPACNVSAITIENHMRVTNFDKCNACFACVTVCPFNACEEVAKEMTSSEVVEKARKDAMFYSGSGGGLTIGGGEPMFQPKFTTEILSLAKEAGIHTAVETSAFGALELFFSIAKSCDHMFVDLKAMDTVLHEKITGVPNGRILENIRLLDEKRDEIAPNLKIVFRYPVIVGTNDTQENMAQTAKFIASLSHLYAVELLPFHNFGEGKYKEIGKTYSFESVPNMHKDDVVPYFSFFEKEGVEVIHGGKK